MKPRTGATISRNEPKAKIAWRPQVARFHQNHPPAPAMISQGRNCQSFSGSTSHLG